MKKEERLQKEKEHLESLVKDMMARKIKEF